MSRRKTVTSETGLTDAFRVNVRGRPETDSALDRLSNLANQCDARDSWGRKVGGAPIVNALVLYVDRLPREQKVAILEASIKMLAEAIAIDLGEDPATFRPGAPATSRRRKASPKETADSEPTLGRIAAAGPASTGRGKQPRPRRKITRRRLG